MLERTSFIDIGTGRAHVCNVFPARFETLLDEHTSQCSGSRRPCLIQTSTHPYDKSYGFEGAVSSRPASQLTDREDGSSMK